MPEPGSRPTPNPVVSESNGLRRGRSTANPATVPGPRKLTPPIPTGLLGTLAALPEELVLPSVLESLNRLHGGLGCVLFRVESGIALSADELGDEASGGIALVPELSVPAPVLNERFLQASGDLLGKACEPVARESVKSGEAVVAEARLAGGRCVVVAVPSMEGGQAGAVLCRVQEIQHRGEAAALAALQMAGLLRLVSLARTETGRMRSRFGRIAALIELPGAAASGIDFAECARRLANHLRDLFGCETVALSLKSWRGHRLVAVSGETGPVESHSLGRRALFSHLAEAAQQGRTLLYRRDGHHGGGPSAAPIAIPLREWFDPAVSVCLPLVDAGGTTRGAWLFLWKTEPPDLDETRVLIEAAGPEVGPLLTLLHRAKPGPVLGPLVRLWKRGTQNTRRALGVAAIVAGLAALAPLSYPVRATCELQPVVRRVIAAPFDGVLMRATARAGEVVTEGQLLAEMDGRELRSQLAEAIANRERAAKESDQALAEGRIAEARMAELEAEGLSHEIELLEYRRRNLELRSPINGIILRGDLERSEGAPMRVGDPLFEVGPLEWLVAEIAVDATDVPLVKPGARVTVKFESHANDSLTSRILRVSPKSEWIEDRNVFLCEAEIANPRGLLRAGLEGKAKIEGPRRPLAWIWARDAWLALRYHFW